MEDLKSIEEKFIALIEQNQRFVYKVVNAYCSQAEDKKDLFQEIVFHLWKAFPKYDPSQAAFSTWIYRIALNVSISFYRKESVRQKRLQSIAVQSEQATWEDSKTDERLRQLYQFIEQLKPLEKALMILHLEDCKNPEIAEIMGISLSNVSTRLHRIKEKLNIHFKNLKHA